MLRSSLLKGGIIVSLVAETSEEAVRHLVAGIPQSLMGASLKETVIKKIIDREKMGTTAIGEGLALPQCIAPGITQPLTVLGISPSGIDFHSLDGEPVHVFVLNIVPEGPDAHQHKLSLVKSSESVFRDRFVIERLKAADSAEEVLKVVEFEYNRQFQRAVI